MGAFPKKSCYSNPYVASITNAAEVASAPNPEVFKIVQEYFKNGFLVLKVEYPNCTNFEGIKIMVYNCGFKTSAELLKFNDGKLDPHFSKLTGSPIARFRPTQESEELIKRLIGA